MHIRLLTFALAALLGCSTRTLELAESPPDSGAQDGAADALVDTDADLVVFANCRAGRCQCSNGVDDDMDGLLDGFDPDCSYALDDYEASFATGAQDEKGLKGCQDCFFDTDSDSEDGCKRSPMCDGDADPRRACSGKCQPSEECIDSCLEKTPNGCDCFGCCEVHLPSGVVTVRLQEKCSYADMRAGARCTPCKQSDSCRNACDECELCMGKTRDMLPAHCKTGSGDYTCSNGQPCDLSSDCGSGSCIRGCCLPPLLY